MDKHRDTETISDIMRRVKSQDTTPEIAFREYLSAKGLQFQLYNTDLPGKPDILFPNERLAIFIDGDFWHGNQWKKRKLKAIENQFTEEKGKYWVKKIKRNAERDLKNTAQLLSEGWKVLRFWESDIQHDLEKCIELTLKAINDTEVKSSWRSVIAEKSAAEFFAGIGLVRIGLENKGWKVIFANDIDKEKYEWYLKNFPGASETYKLEDIHKMTGADIPTVTLATASFPCNDLSLAGKYAGLSGKHSATIWEFLRVIEEMGERRPPIIMLENVFSFISSKKGNDFYQALRAFNKAGYTCDAFVLNAVNFTPQSRARVFVVAVREHENNSGTLAPGLLEESIVRPGKLVDFIVAHPKINWRIQNLPDPPGRNSNLRDILEDIPHEETGVWWNPKRVDYLLNQMSETHRSTADEMAKKDEYSYGTVFRRVRQGRSMAELRVDGIAGCLRTPRGGSGRQILFKAGKGEYFARLLSARECARLQGVPDTYRIDVPLNKALFGFGDAVCVPAITWIADHYLNPLINSMLRGELLVNPYETSIMPKP